MGLDDPDLWPDNIMYRTGTVSDNLIERVEQVCKLRADLFSVHCVNAKEDVSRSRVDAKAVMFTG